MIASHVTLPVLADAASEIGVTFDVQGLNAKGTRHRVKLYPETPQALYRPPCKRCRERWAENPDTEWSMPACRCRRWPDERGDAKYQRESASMNGNGRRVHAVCWHGFRDFFRAVYRHVPDARFATAMDTWRGAADFEARFRETGHRNIGSQAYPMAAAEACRCPESGYVGSDETADRSAYQDYRQGQALADPVSLTTDDMGTDDILVRPDGIDVERWADYNRKMNDLLMGRSA